MILARKSGWLIATHTLRTTRSGTYVEAIDTPGREIWVSKKHTHQRLCNTIEEAMAFIKEANKEDQ